MRRSEFRIDNALALVTGAGSGIGRATALALAAQGARVLVADIDEASAKVTAERCAAMGRDAQAHRLDVADRAAVHELAKHIESEHGPLDILVNNAGVGMAGRFLDTSHDDWDWIIGINLRGAINCCLAFGPAMVERRHGHVVNVSSGLAYTPRATEPAYVTTKAAILALSRCLRHDWREAGIGVSAICPGVIATPILSRTRFRGETAQPDRVDRAQRLFSRGHSPESVAKAIVSAVRNNRAVVPVGVEAHVGWVLSRVLPVPLADGIGRVTAKVL